MRRRARRPSGRLAALLAALVLAIVALSGCSSGGYQPRGPFRPLPEGAPPEVGPPPSSAPGPRPPQNPSGPGSGQQAGDPNVVASGLAVPIGLVVLPDGTAIVGERDTGRLLQVFPDHSPARVLMTVPGIDATGDGGLLGLAISPTFPEDGLLYAYVSTAADNRVVRFPIGGSPNPVLTGIPRGEVHNGGGLAFGTDGTLFVGTGDTGNPALAEDPASTAGKVLHVDVFGRPVDGDAVFTRGHRDVTALCWGRDHKLLATDAARAEPDELNVLAEGGDYGAPPSATAPLVEIPSPEAGLGGCAAAGSTIFLGAMDGQRIDVVTVNGAGAVTGDPKDLLTGRYGRLRSLALDGEGGLWVTTSNRDGIGSPVADDDRVLRILPPAAKSDSPL